MQTVYFKDYLLGKTTIALVDNSINKTLVYLHLRLSKNWIRKRRDKNWRKWEKNMESTKTSEKRERDLQIVYRSWIHSIEYKLKLFLWNCFVHSLELQDCMAAFSFAGNVWASLVGKIQIGLEREALFTHPLSHDCKHTHNIDKAESFALQSLFIFCIIVLCIKCALQRSWKRTFFS